MAWNSQTLSILTALLLWGSGVGVGCYALELGGPGMEDLESAAPSADGSSQAGDDDTTEEAELADEEGGDSTPGDSGDDDDGLEGTPPWEVDGAGDETPPLEDDGMDGTPGPATEDADGDGFSIDQGDCDDGDSSSYPGAEELPDDLDHDCDGSPTPDNTGYDPGGDGTDVDGDGYSLNDGDCNDRNNAIHPEAQETCNGVDDDCDGQVDEDLPTATYHRDEDGDGYGVSTATQQSCTAAPEGFAVLDGDCNDQDPAVNPGAEEWCNGLDDDCDGSADEDDSIDAGQWYLDEDGDGSGDWSTEVTACYPPVDYVADGADCDDGDPEVYPGAEELEDGKDNDCNEVIDGKGSADSERP